MAGFVQPMQMEAPSMPQLVSWKRIWLSVFPKPLNHEEVKRQVFKERLQHTQGGETHGDILPNGEYALGVSDTYKHVEKKPEIVSGFREKDEVVSVLFVLESYDNGKISFRMGTALELYDERNLGDHLTKFYYGCWQRFYQRSSQKKPNRIPKDVVASQGKQQPAYRYSQETLQRPIQGSQEGFNRPANGLQRSFNATASAFIPATPSISAQDFVQAPPSFSPPGLSFGSPSPPGPSIPTPSPQRLPPPALAAMTYQNSAMVSPNGYSSTPKGPAAMTGRYATNRLPVGPSQISTCPAAMNGQHAKNASQAGGTSRPLFSATATNQSSSSQPTTQEQSPRVSSTPLPTRTQSSTSEEESWLTSRWSESDDAVSNLLERNLHTSSNDSTSYVSDVNHGLNTPLVHPLRTSWQQRPTTPDREERELAKQFIEAREFQEETQRFLRAGRSRRWGVPDTDPSTSVSGAQRSQYSFKTRGPAFEWNLPRHRPAVTPLYNPNSIWNPLTPQDPSQEFRECRDQNSKATRKSGRILGAIGTLHRGIQMRTQMREASRHASNAIDFDICNRMYDLQNL